MVILNIKEIRSGFTIAVTKADFGQSKKKTVTLRPEIVKTFTKVGGLGINFSDEWEIEEIEEDSQAEEKGLRAALWLTHIQDELIAGKESVHCPSCGRPIAATVAAATWNVRIRCF